MKAAAITLTVLVCGIFALVILATFSEGNGAKPEQIERECRRSYGDQGERRVLDCQLEMSVRYLREAERSKANDTYGRIR